MLAAEPGQPQDAWYEHPCHADQPQPANEKSSSHNRYDYGYRLIVDVVFGHRPDLHALAACNHPVSQDGICGNEQGKQDFKGEVHLMPSAVSTAAILVGLAFNAS